MKKIIILISTACLLAFYGCTQNENFKDQQYESSADSSMTEILTGDSIKLVKTASLKFKVHDVEQSSREVSELTRNAGGMIFYQQFDAQEGESTEFKTSTDSLLVISNYTPQANITLKVPSQNLEELIYKISDLGYYTTNNTLKIDDKSLTFLQNNLNSRDRNAVLSEAPKSGSKAATVQEKINIKDDVTNQQIANKYIENDVKYSTVNLNLYQNSLIRKESIANYHVDEYKLSFVNRLGDSFDSGWQSFLSLLLILAQLWIYLLIGALVFIIYKKFQKKISLNIKGTN